MYDIAIVGAGPAGASAAIFAAKAGKKTLVVDSDKGITKRALFQNYYGIPHIAGPDLVDVGIAQLKTFGADYIAGEATSLQPSDDGLTLTVGDGQSFQAKHVILATGMSVALAEKAGVLTEPGTEPWVKSILQTDPAGRTNVPGVWAAGACAGVSVHAVITAGDGAKVAVNVISELNGSRYVDHDVLKPKS